MKVYQAINAVSAELASVGISKTRKNDQQGYRFRGIDEVMNALAPLLANHKLIIFPRMLTRLCEARTTKSGSTLYSVTVEAEFDFVSAEDGSKHAARTFGEAMDSGDKATNKAMAAAYKYAAFQTFCIPLEGSGDVDADATTPEPTHVEPNRRGSVPVAAQPAPEAPRDAHCGTNVLDNRFPAPETPKADPKIAALAGSPVIPQRGGNKEPSMAPKAKAPAASVPTDRDSNRVKVLLISTLKECKTQEQLDEWGEKNGRQSPNWPLMTPIDQRLVFKEVEDKWATFKWARDKAAAGVDANFEKSAKATAKKMGETVAPETGELSESAA